MSKPMIYTYFGSKRRLFDAVFDAHVVANSDRVPFTADDLGGYAARLYDDYLADPALLRLVAWKRLEHDEDGYLFPGHEAHDERHLARIAEAQRRGRIRRDLDPRDVWSILIATAATWGQGSITVVATAADAEADHRRRREALAATVRAGLQTTPVADGTSA
jgi:AcrR family transcriptional regulator